MLGRLRGWFSFFCRRVRTLRLGRKCFRFRIHEPTAIRDFSSAYCHRQYSVRPRRIRIQKTIYLKDSGHTIPGIGGALDLIDSLILTAPLGFVILSYWYN
ncbi:MAG: hypothetical protein EBQ49_03305 [Verrucomicrobia bacterium]|nr:hypothetical protein [Verrucomicrobiota bacterium]